MTALTIILWVIVLLVLILSLGLNVVFVGCLGVYQYMLKEKYDDDCSEYHKYAKEFARKL